jgi:hypothetical protein
MGVATATLPFFDSFDHYNIQADKWTAGSAEASIDISNTLARTGIGCLTLTSGSNGPTLVYPAQTRVVIGSAFYPAGAASVPGARVRAC